MVWHVWFGLTHSCCPSVLLSTQELSGVAQSAHCEPPRQGARTGAIGQTALSARTATGHHLPAVVGPRRAAGGSRTRCGLRLGAADRRWWHWWHWWRLGGGAGVDGAGTGVVAGRILADDARPVVDRQTRAAGCRAETDRLLAPLLLALAFTLALGRGVAQTSCGEGARSAPALRRWVRVRRERTVARKRVQSSNRWPSICPPLAGGGSLTRTIAACADPASPTPCQR